MTRARWLAAAASSMALLFASTASAQDAGVATNPSGAPAGAQAQPAPVRWPLRVPGLDATVNDPRDGRDWSVTTRVTGAGVTVVAAAQNAQIALVFEQRRLAPAQCATVLAGEARAQQAVYTLRAEPASAVRAPSLDAEAVFQLRAGGFDLEYGCVTANGRPWLVTAMTNTRAGLVLGDAAAMFGRVYEALRGRGARGDGSVRLDVTALDLGVVDIDGPWLFNGEATGFPLAGDVLSSRAGDRGGVTISVGVRQGRCAEAWDALRAWLTSEGQRVDRPAYVPAAFGPRIRRVTSGERVREVYCAQPTPERALVVSTVFAADDADATERARAMIERVLRAATPAQAASRR
jgi:hypothetical protein